MYRSAPGHFTSATIASALICMASFGVALASSTPELCASAVVSCKLGKNVALAVAAEIALLDLTLYRQAYASFVVNMAMLSRWRNGAVASLTVRDRFASVAVARTLMGMVSSGVVPAVLPPEVCAFAAENVLLGMRLSLAVVAKAASSVSSQDDTGVS